MKKVLIAMACLATLAATAQNREIQFREGSWKDQLATAKKENKLIFLDCYTSWCGPCKMMARDVFTKDSVADMFNQSFIDVKYDMEKGEGVTLKTKYAVAAFPTYLFINGDGEVVNKLVGSMSPADFMKEAGNSLHPENTVFGLAKKFNAGDHSEATAVAYFEALDKAYEADEMAIASKIYFDSFPQSSLLEEHNWNLALKYLNNPSSQAFAYLYAHKDALDKKYEANDVDMYFRNTLAMSVYSVKRAYQKNTGIKEAREKMQAIRKLLANENEYSKPLLTQLDLIEYEGNKQWDKFSSKVNTVLDDTDFPQKSYFVITAANDVVSSAPEKYYSNAAEWANRIEKTNPDLFTQIQLSDLRKRIFKKEGKTADAEAMASKSDELRKEAAQKGQMTPQIMKD